RCVPFPPALSLRAQRSNLLPPVRRGARLLRRTLSTQAKLAAGNSIGGRRIRGCAGASRNDISGGGIMGQLGIGQRVRRFEYKRLSCGNGRFQNDVNLPTP